MTFLREKADVPDLSGLIEEIRKLCTMKGWRQHAPGGAPREGHVFGAYVALGHSEFSEALEAYRDKIWSATCTPLVADSTDRADHHTGCNGKKHGPGKPVGVGPELADVFIRLLDMSDMWGVNMEYEIARVLDYGWTRPYRHGGRQL
jgi:hypothetical protein